MKKEIRYVHSNIPIYIVGIVWILYALLFPMYRILDYVIVAVLSVAGYVISSAIIPKKEVIVEVVEELEEIKTGISAADEILAQGRTYILELSEVSKKISSPVIRKNIEEMDEVSRKIYKFLSEHPEKAVDARTFTNYYLPTTISLLKSYVELEEQGDIKGKNITEMTEKIEGALGGFISAYKKLLDDLYQDKSMDLAADISVLHTMMEQEGLVEGQNIMGSKRNIEYPQPSIVTPELSTDTVSEGIEKAEKLKADIENDEDTDTGGIKLTL